MGGVGGDGRISPFSKGGGGGGGPCHSSSTGGGVAAKLTPGGDVVGALVKSHWLSLTTQCYSFPAADLSMRQWSGSPRMPCPWLSCRSSNAQNRWRKTDEMKALSETGRKWSGG